MEFLWNNLRAIKFPDYSKYTCVNDAYQDFVTQFLAVIDCVGPLRIFLVKYNTKTWFDIDVFNAIRNREKHYKKFKRSGKKID